MNNDDVATTNNLLYEYQQLPSARLFQNYNAGVGIGPSSHTSNYNSGNNGAFGNYTGAYPQTLQQPMYYQPIQPQTGQTPFISDFTSNHSALIERYGLPGNANQLYQNKSEFF